MNVLESDFLLAGDSTDGCLRFMNNSSKELEGVYQVGLLALLHHIEGIDLLAVRKMVMDELVNKFKKLIDEG